MTTYTFSGFSQLWEDTTGDGNDDTVTFGTATLQIVARDSLNSFTYEIDPNPSDGGSFPEVIISDFEPYSITLNGQEFDGQNSETKIAEIQRGAGNATQILNFSDDGLNHMFVVGGAALPTFTSAADFEAFKGTVTYSGQVTSGPLLEGLEIQLRDLGGVTVTENDQIVGTGANEVFFGGLGRDKIYGNNGDDRLFGGAGNDRVFGGAGNDKVFGGAGRDKIFGGAGQDLIDGGKGNDVLVGGSHADIFVFRAKFGKDIIRDFTDNKDTLQLDDSLWSGDLTKKQVLQQFASIIDGDLVLDFGRHELTLKNFDSINALLNDLEII